MPKMLTSVNKSKKILTWYCNVQAFISLSHTYYQHTYLQSCVFNKFVFY